MEKIITLFIPFFICFGLFAQQNNPNDYQDGILLEQIDVSNSSIIQTPQNISVNPLGMGFREVMEQLRARVSSTEQENHVQITQNGNGNTAEITQEGMRNAAEINQKGNSNNYQGSLTGEDNLIHILQTGSGNTVYQELYGYNIELQVIQHGSGNELIQIETAGNAPIYQVQQKGEGMRIVIEHSAPFSVFGNP